MQMGGPEAAHSSPMPSRNPLDLGVAKDPCVSGLLHKNRRHAQTDGGCNRNGKKRDPHGCDSLFFLSCHLWVGLTDNSRSPASFRRIAKNHGNIAPFNGPNRYLEGFEAVMDNKG